MAGRLATGTLAARGAGNPAAFAAFIASRARGQQVMNFTAETSSAACPNCGYRGEALPDISLSTQLDMATPRYPVASPNDVLVSRTPQGTASIRHRRGGTEIGEIRQGEQGWQAVYEGRELSPHTHQRGALAELLGTWNKGTGSLARPAAAEGSALQPPPVQTPLMERFGIPAVHTFAFPNAGSSDGPRVTKSGSDDDDDDTPEGLGPKGKSVHKKLRAKGWPPDKAHAFAKRADNMGK
jgi:hypothetical protein